MYVTKRIFMIVFILLLGVFIVGCQLNQPKTVDKPGINIKPTNNEVVDIHGQLENIERLDLFIKNVHAEKKDNVRLTRYTIEGDPIFYDLTFEGSKLTVKIDTTEDKFGQSDVESYLCKSIQKQESITETKYILEDCPDIGELLTITHDIDKEDYFAFELKYGVGLKNKIDTKNQELIKDLQNGQTAAIMDFQFSKEEMNNIYKLMIISNYLEEKKLSKECKLKPYESYEMSVWINSAERHFEWSKCDSSKDGKEMSELVLNILEILKNNPTFQTLAKE
jgi:hypothetical protein